MQNKLFPSRNYERWHRSAKKGSWTCTILLRYNTILFVSCSMYKIVYAFPEIVFAAVRHVTHHPVWENRLSKWRQRPRKRTRNVWDLRIGAIIAVRQNPIVCRRQTRRGSVDRRNCSNEYRIHVIYYTRTIHDPTGLGLRGRSRCRRLEIPLYTYPSRKHFDQTLFPRTLGNSVHFEGGNVHLFKMKFFSKKLQKSWSCR